MNKKNFALWVIGTETIVNLVILSALFHFCTQLAIAIMALMVVEFGLIFLFSSLQALTFETTKTVWITKAIATASTVATIFAAVPAMVVFAPNPVRPLVIYLITPAAFILILALIASTIRSAKHDKKSPT